MRRTAVLVSALALSALGWTPGPAHAEPAPTHDDTQITSFSDQEQDTALTFWTTARLRAAEDVTPAARASAATASTHPADDHGPELTVPPLPGAEADGISARASSPTAWKRKGLIRRTSGKVFFENAAGSLFSCSGTVASSRNKSVVLTAAHCVVDPADGKGYRNWVFIPGYAHGERPFGTFTAQKLFHLKRYVTSDHRDDWDFAFARMRKLDGRTLAGTVGAQGIRFNSPTGRRVHSFGYGGAPAEGSGERLNHCQGKEHRDTTRPGSTMWGIDCVQSGGSSGGGFLAGFKADTGSGYLVGTISVGNGTTQFHPRLGDAARKLYRKASTG
ncbi:trypsin-like serine peptidase [Streptomyces sp. NPDC056479]|uniref:trypsin-like serine peptidase n=1 Tax=unclassified Streptomyces TaxID=2593676 RepID=UPI0036BBEE15